MPNIEQFVKEKLEIKLLRTCESYFFTVPKKYAIHVSLYKIGLTKNCPSRYEVLRGHGRSIAPKSHAEPSICGSHHQTNMYLKIKMQQHQILRTWVKIIINLLSFQLQQL